MNKTLGSFNKVSYVAKMQIFFYNSHRVLHSILLFIELDSSPQRCCSRDILEPFSQFGDRGPVLRLPLVPLLPSIPTSFQLQSLVIFKLLVYLLPDAVITWNFYISPYCLLLRFVNPVPVVF